MTAAHGPVLLATCSALPDGDDDAALLTEALGRRGVDARWLAWTDPGAPWADGPVVIRSTWDYTADRDAFVAWACRLPWVMNGADAVAWNSDKTYLRDLAAAGIPIVPTQWVEPGETVPLPVEGEYVVKPSVGAGSKGAGRFTAAAGEAARAHASALHDAGRVVLVQPYLAGVDAAGETALVYFDGVFSHAVRKGAMLPAGTVNPLTRVSNADLFVEERIDAHVASSDELAVGEQVMAVLRDRLRADQLYARVDLLPSPDGPVVVELELVEPSLFLGYGEGAADRFANAIAARVAARP